MARWLEQGPSGLSSRYFDFPNGDWDIHLKALLTNAEVPTGLLTTALARVQEIADDAEANCAEGPHEQCTAGLSGDGPVAILDANGETIGYIFHVWYYYDSPLFDGGGTRLYYNLAGDLITEVDWWG